MQQKLEILPLYQLYIPIQARQLLLPWSEKSKSSEQRSVYSKPEVQGICRDHILLKFEEKPSINVYICIDQSGTLWKNIEHICQEWIHNHDALLEGLLGGVDSTRLYVGWYPREDYTLDQTTPSIGDGSLFQPMPQRYLPCSGVPLCQQWNILTVTSKHIFIQNLSSENHLVYLQPVTRQAWR